MEETITSVNPSAMPENKAMRAFAKGELKGNWTQPVLCTLVYFIVTGAVSAIPVVSWVSFLILCPLTFGYALTCLNYMRGQNREEMVSQPFQVFKEYGRTLGTSLLMYIFIALWSLLLFIPGIIMSYAYAMTPYLMKDNPEMGAMECIKKSKAMMKGYKWKLFLLDLGFIGWILLTIITFGIYGFWLQPWMQCTRAKFYEELKARQN
ncbi:MAG: DUF975 family protein [Bacteroidales bacterium]|nr:DUF975 family protein [Bacteroidales bacterium]